MPDEIDLYPFHLIAAKSKDVTEEQLLGALTPLLYGTHAILKALSEGYRMDLPSFDELEHSLRLLAGVTGLACDFLTRRQDTRHRKDHGHASK